MLLDTTNPPEEPEHLLIFWTSAMPAVKASAPPSGIDILDVRGDQQEINLKQEVLSQFNPEPGVPRKLPTLLLYDEKGLQLFEDVRCSLPCALTLA